MPNVILLVLGIGLTSAIGTVLHLVFGYYALAVPKPFPSSWPSLPSGVSSGDSAKSGDIRFAAMVADILRQIKDNPALEVALYAILIKRHRRAQIVNITGNLLITAFSTLAGWALSALARPQDVLHFFHI